jgi:hypothetical protein
MPISLSVCVRATERVLIRLEDAVQDFVIFDGERLHSNHGLKGRNGTFCVLFDTEGFFGVAGWQCLAATRPRAGFSSADLIAQ